MYDKFYKVIFEGSNEEFYFHNHEDAAAFLLDAYFDDFDIATENECIAINNQLADTDAVEDYGWIEECYFEA